MHANPPYGLSTDFRPLTTDSRTPDSRLAADRTVEHATCLGCGCACDDITLVAREGRIAEARQACPLGVDWFGDGAVPARVRSSASDTSVDSVASALAAAGTLLRDASRPLVYLAGDISCETQRASIAIADVLGAVLDSVTSSTAGLATIATQRRGRVTATLGEIRNRADCIVFWGVDPAARYPRFQSRYAPDPPGLYVPGGRRDRTVIAIDIGGDRGPVDADVRVALSADEEVSALDLARAAVVGRGDPTAAAGSLPARVALLAQRLQHAKYLAIVADGEPARQRDPRRTEALMLLVEALNGATRCVLSTLRGGGNRTGAESTMTAQTGYPMAVDFGRRTPRYRPDSDAAAMLRRGEIDVALIVGAPGTIPDAVVTGLGGVQNRIAIGPRASESAYELDVAIDTGVAGVHERGSVVRMDDIPLPLRPPLEPAVVATFRDRPASVGVPLATIARVSRLFTGTPSVGTSAPAVSGESPELAVTGALARAGLPQDSYIILRILGATLARMVGIA
jgi:formylmethanofuran dehydrogenase subunit B